MREIDRLSIKLPFFGTRKVWKRFGINRKRAQRLMRLLGLEAVCPKRSTSRPAPGHKVYPYLLRNMAITKPDQVWASDITYIPLQHGFLYLTAVMDLYSRVRTAQPSPYRRRDTVAGSIRGYFRAARRRARFLALASARAVRSSTRYWRTASGCVSFQTSGLRAS